MAQHKNKSPEIDKIIVAKYYLCCAADLLQFIARMRPKKGDAKKNFVRGRD